MPGQDGSKTTQDRPKTPQDGPEAPERRPDMSQDEPRRLKMDLPKLTRAPAVRFSVRCLDSRDVIPITRPCARLANQSELKGAHGCLFMSVITQSIKQSTNQPINLSTYQSINQSVHQAANQSVNQSISQSVSQSIDQSISHCWKTPEG